MTIASESPTAETPSPRRRLRLRFSLRTILVLISVVAVVLGLVHDRAQRQRLAVEAIQALGGSVTYDWQLHARLLGQSAPPNPPSHPQWLRDWLGPHALEDVVELQLGADGWLELDQGKLSDFMPHAVKLQAVRRVGLSSKDIDRNEGRLLAQLAKLEEIVGRSVTITLGGAQELAKAPRLNSIDLDNAMITVPALAALAESPSLQSLRLSSVVTTAPLVEAPLVLPLQGKFEFVSRAIERQMETVPPAQNWLADDGLRALVHCKQLRTLHLSNSHITDAGVAELGDLKQLEFLSIGSPHITGKSLETIATLPNLRSLQISEGRLAADDLLALEAMPNLTWLFLNTDLSDDFVPRLAKLTQLKLLFLEGPGLTDACLPDFHACKNLRQLNLSCTNVKPLSPAAIALRTALPNCSISLPWTLQQKRQMRLAPPSAVQNASP